MASLRVYGFGATLCGFALTCVRLVLLLAAESALPARAATCAPPAPSATSYTADGCNGTVPGGTFNTGATAYAAVFHAINAGTITVTAPVTLESAGDNSTGAYANNGGSIDFGASTNTSTISVIGAHSNGVHAFSTGAFITGSINLTTSGDRAHGAFMDYGGVIVLHDSTLVTNGYQAAGVAVATGAFTLSGPSSILTTGDGAPGLSATSGNSSIAIDALDGRTSVVTTGAGSAGAKVDSSDTITLRGVDLRTIGDVSNGLYVSGAGSVITADDTTVTTLGASSIGAQVLAGGSLTLTGGAISTGGSAATGLAADGAGSTIVAQGTHISTSGASADGIDVSHGAQLALDAGSVSVSGQNANALHLAGAGDATTQTALLANSTLASAQGSAIDVLNGVAVVRLAGGKAAGPALLTLESVTLPSQIDLLASGSALCGAALMSGAASTGAIAQLTLVNGTSWTITGDSILTGLSLDNSTVAFASPALAGFHTLTLTRLTGGNATLVMNTSLGSDTSPTDRVIVNGGAVTGTTGLRFLNAGGRGQVTTYGIPVIVVLNGGTAPAGSFVQLGRAVAGPYEYHLFRADSGNWLLSSQRILIPPLPPLPPSPTPPAPPGPTPTPVPDYRPEVPVYLANEYAATAMFIHTLRDRMPTLPASGNSAWLRLTGRTDQGSGPADNYSARTNTIVLQGGGDIMQRALFSDADRLHLGAMAAYGNAQSAGYAAGNDAQTSGSTQGYSGGVYATWFADAATQSGAYVDSWFQYAWFDNAVNGSDLPGVHYHTQRMLASLEGGWAFAPGAGANWQIVPQAQAIWVHRLGVDTTEPNGTTLNAGVGNDLMTRLGVRIVRALELAGALLQCHLTLNWWHDSSTSSVDFSGVTLDQSAPANRYEARIGIESAWSPRWSGMAEIGGQWGRSGTAGDYRQYALRLAARYRW
ncbi:MULTISPECIES: autotransporter outer membrane beta-barrel domain-containing protein [unclassified Paraburkholderia]|uniref:autotransporter family protein n=1 Tax=unclassified Paraburkholderia TaxID=2615204 RepID=UPI002AB1CC4C|nr:MULTISPECIES: autotransporter outer membrane beta-barrel domain-containing protein [unclassified Paraburkholderia]